MSRLSRNLKRVKEYERLLGRQEKLFEDGEFERLFRVLDKKSKVLSEIRVLHNGAAQAKREAGNGSVQIDGDSTNELLTLFNTKIRELASREKAGLKKALIGRAELAEQLQIIYHGKKLLRGYKPGPSDGKARFKDIKT